MKAWKLAVVVTFAVVGLASLAVLVSNHNGQGGQGQVVQAPQSVVQPAPQVVVEPPPKTKEQIQAESDAYMAEINAATTCRERTKLLTSSKNGELLWGKTWRDNRAKNIQSRLEKQLGSGQANVYTRGDDSEYLYITSPPESSDELVAGAGYILDAPEAENVRKDLCSDGFDKVTWLITYHGGFGESDRDKKVAEYEPRLR